MAHCLTFQVGQTWYLWRGLVWQISEIRAVVDTDVVVWRTPRTLGDGYDYACVLQSTLLRAYANQELVTGPPFPRRPGQPRERV